MLRATPEAGCDVSTNGRSQRRAHDARNAWAYLGLNAFGVELQLAVLIRILFNPRRSRSFGSFMYTQAIPANPRDRSPYRGSKSTQ